MLNALNEAIEEAYAAGYKDGFDDGYANRERPQSPVKYKELVYRDLGLPSGTKWASSYLTNTDGSIEAFSLSEANVFTLPTKEQYQELLENTHQLYENHEGCNGTSFISKINSTRLFLPRGFSEYQGNRFSKNNYVFWLREKDISFNKRLVYGASIVNFTTNYKYPVVLVSK